MPGLFIAAELILTCYLTESPWIIISGSDRQVENAGEHMLIQGCVSVKPERKTDRAYPQSWMKSHKTLSRSIVQYESPHVITCALEVQVHFGMFEYFSMFFFSATTADVCASESFSV